MNNYALKGGYNYLHFTKNKLNSENGHMAESWLKSKPAFSKVFSFHYVIGRYQGHSQQSDDEHPSFTSRREKRQETLISLSSKQRVTGVWDLEGWEGRKESFYK